MSFLNKNRKETSETIFRPMVVGDEHLAYRLQVHFLEREDLNVDPLSYIENTWRPNLYIVVGPANDKLLDKVEKTLKKNDEYRLIYACSTLTDEGQKKAEKVASKLNADISIIKRFVGVEDVGEAIKRLANV
ncbi:MAG: hypothetical protein CME64_10820 [Halobacteriovoraceae bacterium]|nr:hypothetical protein [Halobacteriovoraceae bacterium]|tara:strand:+ start:95974 stop:96369 length:396 start_codon:yes stop_codon:yes gene_type:complete